MSSEWKETTIGDQLTLQRGFDITRKQQVEGDIPVVSSGGISSYHNEFKVSGPGVVLGRKGTLGTVFYLPTNYWPHDTSLWVKDFKGNNPKFVYYFFRNMSTVLKDMDVGAANPTLNRNHIHPAEILWPPLSEQKRIAHILGSLDDKIELNRKMNETLEGMAQALFKSWFVDFDPVIDNALAAGHPIPDELLAKAEKRKAQLSQSNSELNIQNSKLSSLFPSEFTFTDELGWIPKGWEVKALDQFFNLIGGGTPKRSEEDYWGGDIPWYSVKDVPNDGDVFVIDTGEKITELGLKKSSTKLLREGMTIISARGTVGKLAMVGVPMAFNQSCYGIEGKDQIGDFFTFFCLQDAIERLQQNTHGAVFDTITKGTFETVRSVLPHNEILDHFEKMIQGSMSKIKINNQENVSLTKLRDTLLPKLLSGDADLQSAKDLASEVL